MGKKRITVLGDTQAEETAKKVRDTEREQKKLRDKKSKTTESEVDKSLAEAEKVAEVLDKAHDIAAAAKTAKKPIATNTRKRGKNYLSAKTKIDPTKKYSLEEAIKMLKEMKTTKFASTVELHLNCLEKVNVSADLPHSTGKSRKVEIATDEIIKDIEAGKMNFDILFASPSQMAKMAKLAKVLGPRGLMPNPKNGTVTNDPEKAAKEYAASSKITIKSEAKAPVVHTMVGKINQKDSELISNTQAVLEAVKTKNIKAIFLKSTMSPAIKVIL
jgi:large subunit ribosomal protein L1